MTKPWISDGQSRKSAKYIAVLEGLKTGEPVAHLAELRPLQAFTVSYGGDDLDRRSRHLLHRREWLAGRT